MSGAGRESREVKGQLHIELAGHGKGFGIYPKSDGFEQGYGKRLTLILKSYSGCCVENKTIGERDESRETSWETLAIILARSSFGLA